MNVTGNRQHQFTSTISSNSAAVFIAYPITGSFAARTTPGGRFHQKPFFLLLSSVTVRYLYRGGFLGSFTIGLRSSLPSAYFFNRRRLSQTHGGDLIGAETLARSRLDPFIVDLASVAPMDGPLNVHLPLLVEEKLLSARSRRHWGVFSSPIISSSEPRTPPPFSAMNSRGPLLNRQLAVLGSQVALHGKPTSGGPIDLTLIITNRTSLP
jgi:hypothetical protein